MRALRNTHKSQDQQSHQRVRVSARTGAGRSPIHLPATRRDRLGNHSPFQYAQLKEAHIIAE